MAQRILLGLQQGMYGFWISQPGVNYWAGVDAMLVDTTDPQSHGSFAGEAAQLNYDHTDGTNNYYVLNIYHNFGYIPIFSVSGNTPTNWITTTVLQFTWSLAVANAPPAGQPYNWPYGTFGWFILRNEWSGS